MKLRVLSDLHLEMHRDGGASLLDEIGRGEDEVLILAGDIEVGAARVGDALDRFCDRFRHVFYVMGNHEYYGGSPAALQEEIREWAAARSNLDLLERDRVTLDGTIFAGTTLWFPDGPANADCASALSDFSAIDGFHDWVYEENRRCLEFIDSLDGVDVMVTHHLPLPACIDPVYHGSRLNRFFLCDVSEALQRLSPRLWVHGHTHTAVDLTVGTTRVLANPFGYPFETAFGFSPRCTVEL
ncbi:MAG: metallophosphoesterase [Planctomycetota bacterium]